MGTTRSRVELGAILMLVVQGAVCFALMLIVFNDAQRLLDAAVSPYDRLFAGLAVATGLLYLALWSVSHWLAGGLISGAQHNRVHIMWATVLLLLGLVYLFASQDLLLLSFGLLFVATGISSFAYLYQSSPGGWLSQRPYPPPGGGP